MIRAAARNALVRALRLNECLEDVEALYAEPKPWCFIKLYGTEKEGKYWYSFANTPEGAKGKLNLCGSKKQSFSAKMKRGFTRSMNLTP